MSFLLLLFWIILLSLKETGAAIAEGCVAAATDVAPAIFRKSRRSTRSFSGRLLFARAAAGQENQGATSAGTPPKSPGMLKERKKTIARILTIIRDKTDQKTEVKNKQ